jgi:hypothetical protein
MAKYAFLVAGLLLLATAHATESSGGDGVDAVLANLCKSHYPGSSYKRVNFVVNNKVVLNLAVITIVQNSYQTNVAFGLVGDQLNQVVQQTGDIVVVQGSNRKLLEDGSGRQLLTVAPTPNYLQFKIDNSKYINFAKVNIDQTNSQYNSALIAVSQYNIAEQSTGVITIVQ